MTHVCTYPLRRDRRRGWHRAAYDSRIDQKIAEELIIGLQTVSTHVGDIPNKTGAANKTEAVDYANQPGLVEANSEGGEQSPS